MKAKPKPKKKKKKKTNRELDSANGITLEKLREYGAEAVLTKTGYISKAGRCEITVFKVPSNNIYSITLLDADTDKERKSIIWTTVKDLVAKG